jgi:hypothetical protein
VIITDFKFLHRKQFRVKAIGKHSIIETHTRRHCQLPTETDTGNTTPRVPIGTPLHLIVKPVIHRSVWRVLEHDLDDLDDLEKDQLPCKRDKMAELPKSVGWVGLGLMGYPMVTNPLKKLPEDTQFFVYDVVKESVDKFVGEGGGRVHACANSKEVADKSVRNNAAPTLYS